MLSWSLEGLGSYLNSGSIPSIPGRIKLLQSSFFHYHYLLRLYAQISVCSESHSWRFHVLEACRIKTDALQRHLVPTHNTCCGMFQVFSLHVSRTL